VVGPGVDQLQAGLNGEYPLAAAERDRVHGEDVFVDEPEADEGLGGADAAGEPEPVSGA